MAAPQSQAQPLPENEVKHVLSEKAADLSLGEDRQDGGSDAASFKDAPEHSPETEAGAAKAAEAEAQSVPANAHATQPPSLEELAPKHEISAPIPQPLPTSKPEPAAELSADEKSKYEELLKAVKAWAEIPKTTAKDAASEPINNTDRMWLTRECLLRYLRATKWSVADAEKRLKATLSWQREIGLRDRMTSEYISVECETGKMFILGFDKHARPCLYLNPAKQNTSFKEFGERQVHATVFMLERVLDLLGPGQETLSLVINYRDSSSSKNPPISQSRQILNILQQHYPERLGRALVCELPWFVTAFFKLITPFIDPVTRQKLRFNEPMLDHVPKEQLLKLYGGDLNFVYKHEIYWPALVKICGQRTGQMMARWEKAGKQLGESELYLKGGEGTSLNGAHQGRDAL